MGLDASRAAIPTQTLRPIITASPRTSSMPADRLLDALTPSPGLPPGGMTSRQLDSRTQNPFARSNSTVPLGHACWPPSPACSSNQTLADLGIRSRIQPVRKPL